MAAMEAKSAILLDRVAVSFQTRRSVRAGGFEALHDISLDVRHGEKLGVIGRNGAGKSTLLRVLAGVLAPDSGRVERNHGRCQLLALGTGFMPNLTGRENALLSGLLQGMERREVLSRLEAMKEFSELGDFFEQPVKTYSSGMRARLGFSVAIQQQPDVLLIDETLSVGDASFKAKSKQALAARLGGDATVVLVSHSEATIADLCDRAVWLDAGRTRLAGRPDEVLQAYARASG
jgi:lipopolysaccharide transport system ATP-binding protein